MADRFKSHHLRDAGSGPAVDKTAPKSRPPSPPVPKAKLEQALADQRREPPAQEAKKKVQEIGGPKGPEPTRYGDWEVGGRCVDF